MYNNNQYSKRLHTVIPGGAHTYSRGDDQFPSNAPAILSRGHGAKVYDAEENEFIDYGMGLRSVTVGYGYESISQAAFRAIQMGNNLTRPTLLELEAAELLVNIIDGAEMVKFAKNGSNVTTAALKIARAYTNRKYVAICAEHPFFSFDDWFIGTTSIQRGIPLEHSGLTLKFHYNDIESLERLFAEYPDQIAAVMLEPVTTVSPCHSDCDTPNNAAGCASCPRAGTTFLHQVQTLTKKNNAVFILDEMISGFRWHKKGAQHYFGVDPDISTFGKAMANGFSLAAMAGKKDLMKLGSIDEAGAERLFLISTTHGAEMCALGAFIETMKVYDTESVVDHIWAYGSRLIEMMNATAVRHGVQDSFKVIGYPCSPTYMTLDGGGSSSFQFRTLFAQEMIRNGVMMPWIALSKAHDEKIFEQTTIAIDHALGIYKKALENGVENYLQGHAIKPVFRTHN